MLFHFLPLECCCPHRFHPYPFLFTLHTSFRQHFPFLWLHTLSLSLSFGFIYSVSYWLFSLNFPWALHTQPGKKRIPQLLLNHSKIFLVLVALPPIPDKNLNYPRPLSQFSHSIPKSRHQCISLFLINLLLFLFWAAFCLIRSTAGLLFPQLVSPCIMTLSFFPVASSILCSLYIYHFMLQWYDLPAQADDSSNPTDVQQMFLFLF